MSIIANLFGWFRMSENSNTETPSDENSRPTLGHAYDSRPGWAVRSSNSTNEHPRLIPTLGHAQDSRPRIDVTSGWAVTSRDLTGNLSTNYYSNNDVWNMPTVTGRDAREAVDAYIGYRNSIDYSNSTETTTGRDLVHEFERYMEARRSNRTRETEELIKQSARLDQINHFRDSIGYLTGQAPNISSDEVVKLANIIHTYSHLNLDAEGKDRVLQWLANVVEHCSHSTEELEDDNSVDL